MLVVPRKMGAVSDLIGARVAEDLVTRLGLLDFLQTYGAKSSRPGFSR